MEITLGFHSEFYSPMLKPKKELHGILENPNILEKLFAHFGAHSFFELWSNSFNLTEETNGSKNQVKSQVSVLLHSKYVRLLQSLYETNAMFSFVWEKVDLTEFTMSSNNKE